MQVGQHLFTVSEDDEGEPQTNRPGRATEKEIEGADFKKSKTVKRTPRRRAHRKGKEADEVETAKPDSYSAYNESYKLDLFEVASSVDPQERQTPSSFSTEKFHSTPQHSTTKGK